MARKRRRRLIKGVVPRAASAIGAWVRRLFIHPQVLILCGVLAASVWALWSYAQQADAFRIDAVEMPPESTLKLRRPLIGENLWVIDINLLAQDLKQQQPWLKDVRVTRQLPNAIRIDAIARLPVAQVKIDHWYPVDREGIIVPQGSAAPHGGLPRLVGVGLGRGADGARNPSLQLALRVLQRIRREPPSLWRRMTEINVADPQQVRFLMDLSGSSGGLLTEAPGETEVRCGTEEELTVHLERLRGALRALAKQPLTVQYIDVRFPEPVISPRT